MTVERLQAELDRLDKGVLLHGIHPAGANQFCALEFSHAVRGHVHSDRPGDLPDLRALNDGPWSSDAARTTAMLPVLAALWNWQDWTTHRQVRWAKIVAVRTVNQLVSALPRLSDAVRQRCRDVTTPIDAVVVARAAQAETGWMMAQVFTAEAAAEAAAAAAWLATATVGDAAEAAVARRAASASAAAGRAASAAAAAAADMADAVLQQACQIWIDAAQVLSDYL